MKTRRHTAKLLALISGLAATVALAGPRDLIVVRPGGPAALDEARAQVVRLIAEIGRKAGWPEGSAKGYYFDSEKEALAQIQKDRPGFLLTTPGFYLAHREDLKLAPVNQVAIDGKVALAYYIVARKGGVASLEALKGKVLAGAPLAEKDFVERIVLSGRFTLGKDVQIQPLRGLSALRKLAAGEVDAVILEEKEHAAMASLPFAADLVTIFTSEPVPTTGVLSIGGTARPADAEAVAKATAGFCESGEGQTICKTYGITGFVPAPPGVYDALIKKYGAPAGAK